MNCRSFADLLDVNVDQLSKDVQAIKARLQLVLSPDHGNSHLSALEITFSYSSVFGRRQNVLMFNHCVRLYEN